MTKSEALDKMLYEGIIILEKKKTIKNYNREQEDLDKLYQQVKDFYPIYEDFFVELNDILINYLNFTPKPKPNLPETPDEDCRKPFMRKFSKLSLLAFILSVINFIILIFVIIIIKK